jgi:hypothetical protein
MANSDGTRGSNGIVGWTNRPSAALSLAAAVALAALSLAACSSASTPSDGSPSGNGPGSSGSHDDSGDDAGSTSPGDDATLPSGDDASTGDGSTPAPPLPSFTDAELMGQGCDLSRTAVGYVAGASTSTTSAPETLVPCFSPSGFGGQEATMGIAKDGTVFLAPAYGPNGNGLVKSTDYGATWTQIVPSGHGRVQPHLYLDPATDRLFFATSTLNAPDAGSATGFDLSWSADEGAT